jgi:hypothetical protein
MNFERFGGKDEELAKYIPSREQVEYEIKQ